MENSNKAGNSYSVNQGAITTTIIIAKLPGNQKSPGPLTNKGLNRPKDGKTSFPGRKAIRKGDPSENTRGWARGKKKGGEE